MQQPLEKLKLELELEKTASNMEARLAELILERERPIFPVSELVALDTRETSLVRPPIHYSDPSPPVHDEHEDDERGSEINLTVDEREERMLLRNQTLRVVPYAHASQLGGDFLYAAADRGCRTVCVKLVQCMVKTRDAEGTKSVDAMIRKAAINAFASAHLDLALYLIRRCSSTPQLDSALEMNSDGAANDAANDAAIVVLVQDAKTTEQSFFAVDEEECARRARTLIRCLRLSVNNGDIDRLGLVRKQMPEDAATRFVEERELCETTAREMCGRCNTNFLPRRLQWIRFVFGREEEDDEEEEEEEEEEMTMCCMQCVRRRDFERRLNLQTLKDCGACGAHYMACIHGIRLLRDGFTDWVKCPECGHVERKGPQEQQYNLTQREIAGLRLGALFGSTR